MNVSEAVASRTSIRAFLPTPVERAVIERVLDKARFAPSGGNLQPWHAVVVAGEPLKRLLDNVQTSSHSNPEYQNYPSPLPDPWMARRRECGFDMYATIGIAREDKQARDAQTARNFIGFGAPCMIFCHTPRMMGAPQWADIGMWVQTVMLLLQEEGLSTCSQGAWSHVGETVRESLGIVDDHILFCGIATGYADRDAPINSLRTRRAPLEDSVRFLGL